MIPRGEQWAEVAAVSGGDLAVTPYGVVVAALVRAGRSGVLRLVRLPVTKKIFFVEGRPVECRSNLAHETFGRFLLNSGKLEEADYRSALSGALSRGVPLGEILIERGLLTPQEVLKNLQRNLARKLLDGFTWTKGEYEFEDGETSPDVTVRVNAPQLILTGALKLTPGAGIQEGLEVFAGEPMAREPRPPFEEEGLKLTGRALRVMQALHVEPLDFEALCSITALTQEEVERVVYALALLGQIVPARDVAHRKLAERPKKAPAAPVKPAPESAEPFGEPVAAAVDDQALLLRQTKIVESYLSFRRKDSFDFLELQEGCTLEEIQKAYLEAAETYAPWSLLEMGVTDFAEQGELLFLKAAQAYSELANSESRGSLIHRRKVLRDEEAAGKKAQFSIKTDLLDSEEQFGKGLALAEQGELGKALELLEFAADCDPQSARYRAELAYRRDQFESHRYRKQSIADLEEAIRIDPRCGEAHYYLGLILSDAGEAELAERCLRQSIKLLAPDRRPIEALKELAAKR